MQPNKGLSWEQKALIAIAVFSAMATTGICVMLDLFADGSGPMPWPYWAFALVGAVPITFVVWSLKRITPSFLFGLWLGTLCLLPWIPYSASKRFFIAADHVKVGMSLDDVRGLMKEFTEEHEQFRGDLTGGDDAYNYAWDRYGVADLDNLTVRLRNGKVASIDLSTE